MNSDLPPEAHHYRRSQTPESPRPLHLPEPANIPVLQNQMDLVFNDTNTYDIAHDTSSLSKPSDAIQAEHIVQSGPLQMTNTLAQPAAYSEGQSHADVQNSSTSNIVVNGTTENQAVSVNSLAHYSNATAPDLQRTLDSLAQFSENANANAQQDQPPSGGEASNEDDALPTTEVSAIDSHAQSDSVVRTDSPDAAAKEGVNYQSLLDTLSQSAATAPIADTLTAPTTASTNEGITLPETGSEKPFPVGAGLPPRPPPQERPAIHPNYSPNESIRSYHHLPPQNINPVSYQSQQTNYRANAGTATGSNVPPPQASARAANGLPPPPIATFQQSPASVAPTQSPSVQSLREVGGRATKSPSQKQDSQGIDDEEQPWGPDIQKKYDQFLHDERIYVTEGVWDRFPPGSRLFVGEIVAPFGDHGGELVDRNLGNLPTEKVTKRDLFHIFHKHGKLAQISLKQAYGFVQFLEATACYDALSKEQGASIRGRKIRKRSYFSPMHPKIV
jgi:RNA recognition motif. (a.k.a. RRM, RBD, or RNP domain)